MFSLKGRVALITGASGGIGASIARALHGQGATLILSDISKELLLPLKEELKTNILLLPDSNIATEEGIKTIISESYKLVDKIDILVNNAGITKDTLAIRMSENDWDNVLNINLKAPFLLSKAIGAKMLRQKSGCIINMASVVAYTGNMGQANYTASKGGLISLTKTLAKEFGMRGIRVNAIAPGFIKTKMTDSLPDNIKKQMLDLIPLNEFGTVEDVANAVVYLASNEAKYITGQTIHINGGMLMI